MAFEPKRKKAPPAEEKVEGNEYKDDRSVFRKAYQWGMGYVMRSVMSYKGQGLTGQQIEEKMSEAAKQATENGEEEKANSIKEALKLNKEATAFPGKPAPDAVLFTLKGKEGIKLSSLLSTEGPTVLNFGSCTWPPFMAKVQDFLNLVQRYPKVKFLIIYVDEAHPTDGWYMKGMSFDFASHQSLKDRQAAAKVLADQLGDLPANCQLYADTFTLEGSANVAYGAKPERLYGIDSQGVIQYKGAMGPFGYKLEEVEAWLAEEAKKPKPAPSKATTVDL